jgi:hypothetical protein
MRNICEEFFKNVPPVPCRVSALVWHIGTQPFRSIHGFSRATMETGADFCGKGLVNIEIPHGELGYCVYNEYVQLFGVLNMNILLCDPRDQQIWMLIQNN